MVRLVGIAVLLAGTEASGAAEKDKHQSCGDVKTLYKDQQCCKASQKKFQFQTVPFPEAASDFLKSADNPCVVETVSNKVTQGNPGLKDLPCKEAIVKALEQAGGDISANANGTMANYTGKKVVTTPFYKAKMCPVNVHWHLGAEHRSQGQFDEKGKAPVGKYKTSQATISQPSNATGRLLGSPQRHGYACYHYNKQDTKFTKEYKWQHCRNMSVGNTYEVHWPHSALGACGTVWQYQSKFYDGVFCHSTPAVLATTGGDYTGAVGVQAQVFVVVNDEKYYYPELIRGMIVGGNYGKDITAYSGSTTGTTRDNKVCSQYSPITWQVDRNCHLISASSFDKMCADMKQQADDMSVDLEPHGAREIVAKDIQAKNVNSGLNHAAVHKKTQR